MSNKDQHTPSQFCWAFTPKHTYIIKRVRVSRGYNWGSGYKTAAVTTNTSFFKQRCCILQVWDRFWLLIQQINIFVGEIFTFIWLIIMLICLFFRQHMFSIGVHSRFYSHFELLKLFTLLKLVYVVFYRICGASRELFCYQEFWLTFLVYLLNIFLYFPKDLSLTEFVVFTCIRRLSYSKVYWVCECIFPLKRKEFPFLKTRLQAALSYWDYCQWRKSYLCLLQGGSLLFTALDFTDAVDSWKKYIVVVP